MNKWRKNVNSEFLESDREYVENLPYKSVDQSTFGLVSEATSYVLVKSGEKIHIKPRTKNLTDLKQALEKSGDPAADFKLGEAEKALEDFADLFEETIKEKGKWEKTIKIARENEEIIPEEDLKETQEGGSGFLCKILDFFRG